MKVKDLHKIVDDPNYLFRQGGSHIVIFKNIIEKEKFNQLYLDYCGEVDFEESKNEPVIVGFNTIINGERKPTKMLHGRIFEYLEKHGKHIDYTVVDKK